MAESKNSLLNLQDVRAALVDRTPWPRAPLGHPGADAALDGGIGRGALHEVFTGDGHATAGAGFAAALAALVGGKNRILWVREDYAALEYGGLNAEGLLGLGLDPGRVVLLRAATAMDALRAALSGVAVSALGAVIAEIPREPKCLDLLASRRLTLAAAGTGVTAILLRPSARVFPSTAETRWRIESAPSHPESDWGAPVFAARLIRNRHGLTGDWLMEWSIDDGIFREFEKPAHPGALVPAFADRPPAAKAERREQTSFDRRGQERKRA